MTSAPTATPHDLSGSALLRQTASFPGLLVLSCVIIGAATFVGAVVPVTAFPYDDIGLLDGVWRVVQGQRAGIDFANPIGFGPFHLAAFWWRLVGPHRWVLGLSIASFSMLIAACAAATAVDRLARSPVTRVAFCAYVALAASAPSIYGWSFLEIGSSAFYNRLSTAGLVVVFLQLFAPSRPARKWRYLVDVGVLSVLIDVSMLTKISAIGVLLVMILASVVVARRALRRHISKLMLAVLVAFILFSMARAICGIPVEVLVKDYQVAAHIRAALLRGSLGGGLARDQIRSNTPLILISTAILVILGIRMKAGLIDLLAVCGVYALCQFALNLANTQPGTLVLAPSCGVIFLAWRMVACETGLFAAPTSRRIWAPAAICAALAAPQLAAILFGAGLATAMTMGAVEPVILGAGGPLTIPIRQLVGQHPFQDYAVTLSDGLSLLRRLDLTRSRIATLDYANAFPLLLQAPSPHGLPIFWAIGMMEPNAQPTAAEVFGDACVMMVPLKPTNVVNGNTARLAAAARPVLGRQFLLIAQDGDWKVYRRNGSC